MRNFESAVIPQEKTWMAHLQNRSSSNESVVTWRLQTRLLYPSLGSAIIPPKLGDRLEASYFSDESENTLQVRGLKLYLDGSLGARTAAVNEPYNDSPTSSGVLTLSNEELNKVVSKARDSNFQLCIHAIGDKAVDLAVQVLGETFGAEGCRRLRHRIEHSSIVNEEPRKERQR